MQNIKKYDVLCLNRAYIPVHIISWDKAISLIYQEKVRALDREYISYGLQDWLNFTAANAEEYYKVKSVNYAIALPEIIVSVTFNSLPSRQVKYTRQSAYCGKTFKMKDLTVDHIIPKGQGGKTEWSNVITSCFPCNQHKANRTPVQAKMPLLFRPHKPAWCSPLQHVNIETHPCKSWKHFMKRIDLTQNTEEVQ